MACMFPSSKWIYQLAVWPTGVYQGSVNALVDVNLMRFSISFEVLFFHLFHSFKTRSFTVILSVIAAVLAAPVHFNSPPPSLQGVNLTSVFQSALVPRAVVLLAVICTDVNFAGSCVTIVSPAPFDSAHPIACAPMTAPFIKSVSSTRGMTDGYTCFLYPELNCGGTRLVVSEKISDFRAAVVNFNDKVLSWNCGSALTSL
ncbi:hypothetical protein DFH09DRAFT_1370131 [Mycena vulgaris]|nr:hypothetical protein DFH09DRAFT_1370131 [Mycena vulgaris]